MSGAITGLIATLAAIQVMIFGLIAGRARGTYGVSAPAMTGHPAWERLNRIHQNSIEQFVVFLPLFLGSSLNFDHRFGTILGVVYIVARIVYAVGYARAAETRGRGAILTFIIQALLAITALLGAIYKVVRV